MRPIKFRAWDTEDKKMCPDTRELGEDGFDATWVLHYKMYPPYGTRFELMQFTGLTDKNGMEIWEGDIASIVYLNHPRLNKTGEVVWDADFATYRIKGDNLTDWLGEKGNYEVIGNIFENPELITN